MSALKKWEITPASSDEVILNKREIDFLLLIKELGKEKANQVITHFKRLSE